MLTELTNYDIYPKVIPDGKTADMTIMPLGGHAAFDMGTKYSVAVLPLTQGRPSDYPDRHNIDRPDFTVGDDGAIRFRFTFHGESEYFIRVFAGDTRVVQLSVYCVGADLAGKYPFMGDLHMHTTRSDGHQCPGVVAANYRRHGYDFLAITDHQRYYPSLEAIDLFSQVPNEFTLVPGEEIHLPGNDVHIVNFGGSFSINGLLTSSAQQREKGDDPSLRSLDGRCPASMTPEQFRAEVEGTIPSLHIPDGIEKFEYAACVWIFDHIREGGGLGIFAHPYWISDVFQVPETFVEYMMQTKPFDAFEVLGGENYFEQNGFQAARYYDDRRRGLNYPIVGSTDSHSSVNNRNAFICSTIIFADKNERTSLINAVKNYHSVAVDSISTEFRLVGEQRLVRYGCFLMNNFFPLHDELCYEEGRAMKDWACGVNKDEAKAVLTAINGRCARQREKYFLF